MKNGGILLALPFFDNLNFNVLIPEEKKEKKNGYSFKEIVMTLLMLMTGGLLKNEEHIKINDSPCMGSVLRRKYLPSLSTLRRLIPELVEKINITELKRFFAVQFIKQYVDREIFYIDGHFMPYNGKEKLLYGYNSIRRIAMKGRTSYVVNSESGRPLYQVLSDNFDNFMDNIIKIINFLKGIIHKKEMLLVFDRGGFGEDFFNKIRGQTKFVCWGKGKTIPPGKGRWKEVSRYFESNIYGEKKKEVLKVKEEGIEMGEEGDNYKLRRFFIKNGEKISSAVTNDFDKPIGDLVRIITKRWGAQENVFKELKKIGYDNIHSYWKDEYSKEFLLENEIDIEKDMINPEYKFAVSRRRKLKLKLGKLSSKIGKQSLMGKKINKPTKGNDKLKNEILEIEKEIKLIDNRIKYLPKNISRYKYIKENKILKLANKKKEYFDLLKFISYNVRRDISRMVGPAYRNNRDIHSIIVKWLNSKCVLKKIDGELILNFNYPRKKNEDKALRNLCEFLNSLNYKHFNTNETIKFKFAHSL